MPRIDRLPYYSGCRFYTLLASMAQHDNTFLSSTSQHVSEHSSPHSHSSGHGIRQVSRQASHCHSVCHRLAVRVFLRIDAAHACTVTSFIGHLLG